MDKLAVLKLDGDFAQGFSVTLQIGLDGDRPSLEIPGTLPPNPDIPQHYNRWRSLYDPKQPMIIAKANQVKNFESDESKNEKLNVAAQILINSLNDWLDSSPFRPIRERLFEQLNPDDSVRAIVQTPDIQLRRLPWHFWDFFSRYPKAEVALSMPAYSRVERSASLRKKVRLLAILGDDSGIDVSADRQFLENLPDAETVFLVKPTRREFDYYLWDEQGWDILFFAGHSKTVGEMGQLSINQHEELKISDLKYALKRAIEQGLHLAIFNSCDGLGLVSPQIDLQIPQIIVMRESVSNVVAQEFLKNFLQAFVVNGKSLYASVREAREKLYALNDEFPWATWLPVICQNPAVKPLTWQELLGKTDQQIPPSVNTDQQIPPSVNNETWNKARAFAEDNNDLGIYNNLRDLLKTGNWREANDETIKLVLRISNRKKPISLQEKDIHNFPCEDLRALNYLWLYYSKGHFGFSVQKRIWQEIIGNSRLNYENCCCFGDRVGWRHGFVWIPYKDLTFSLDAPLGHLPNVTPIDSDLGWGASFMASASVMLVGPLVGFGPGAGGWTLCERAEKCGL